MADELEHLQVMANRYDGDDLFPVETDDTRAAQWALDRIDKLESVLRQVLMHYISPVTKRRIHELLGKEKVDRWAQERRTS